MPYGFMNLQELAGFLGIDQRQAERMAQRGEIPCQKIGGTLRFNRAEITEWLQQRMGAMPRGKLADMDAGITSHRQTDPKEMVITPMLRLESISANLPARTKNSVLKEMVVLADKTQLLHDSELLLETLNEREELCSTAMEGGIAIPHPRRPQPYLMAESIFVIARTSQGIGYGGPDGGLTDLFFMICCTDDRHHLHTLARLCQMLHDDNFVTKLRHAENEEEMLDLMQQREPEVAQSMST